MKVSRDALYLVGGSILLIATPILQIIRENLSSLVWADVWKTLLIVVGTESALIAILALILPSRLSLAAAVALTIWMSAYHTELGEAIRGLKMQAMNDLGGVMALIIFFPVLLIILGFLPRDFVARAIGAVGLALFATVVVQVILSDDLAQISEPAFDPMTMLDQNPLSEPATTAKRLPDIIYIVPDRYGSASTLADVFQHDNGEFLSALQHRGFRVAEGARSNYLYTHLSLASSMNMQYLENLFQQQKGKKLGLKPLYSLIQDNLVTTRLKQMGYRYVHVASWWDGTRHAARADLTTKFLGHSFGGEFGRAVLARAPFAMLGLSAIVPDSQCTALMRQLDYLEDVGGDDGPTFTFAHILAPHTPILIDNGGRCIEPIDYPSRPRGISWGSFKGGYSGYVSYLNKRLLEIFDRQKANNPNSLIFVVQSDEGPWPKAFRERVANLRRKGDKADSSDFDWREASSAQLAMKFGILNALYLGEPAELEVFPNMPGTLSPVNNWRVIFGRLDQKTYPLLPNRHFVYPSTDQQYRSIEITERLNAIPH